MLIDRTRLAREIAAALLKATGAVIVLTILYPYVVTTIAHAVAAFSAA